MKQIFLICVLFSGLLQSAAQSSWDAGKLRMACHEDLDGFCDIQLRIGEIAQSKEATTLVAGAETSAGEAGVRVVIATGMRSGDMNPVTMAPQERSLFHNAVRFERIDESSDRFVAALASLYKLKMKSPVMEPDVRFTAYAFQGQPEKIETRPVLFELYHDDPAMQVPQCEMLLSVDVPKKLLSIREKNQDYRPCIGRIFARPQEP